MNRTGWFFFSNRRKPNLLQSICSFVLNASMAMLSFRHNIIRTLTSDCYCSAPYHPQIGQTVVVQLHIILKLARLLLFSSISSSNWPDCCCSAPYHPQIGQTAVVQLHIILKLTRIARNTGLQAVLTGREESRLITITANNHLFFTRFLEAKAQ